VALRALALLAHRRWRQAPLERRALSPRVPQVRVLAQVPVSGSGSEPALEPDPELAWPQPVQSAPRASVRPV